jgi:hypothetical protein
MRIEKRLIIKIIFEKENFDKNVYKKIDNKILIKILSSHLLIPIFYFKIKKLKLTKYFADELVQYLKEIYKINKSRNEVLIKETNAIVKILNKNNIDYVLLKGASFINSNLYDDNGIRMVGDIDILVNSKCILKASNLLLNHGYSIDKDTPLISSHRHLPRFIHDKKLFAVELHKRLIEKVGFKKLRTNDILKNKIKKYHYNFLCSRNQIEYNIYNHQLNNSGYYKLSYDLKNLYDTSLLVKKTKINNNRIINSYMKISKILNINIFDNIDSKNYSFNFIRFRLREKSFYFRIINDFISNQLNHYDYRKRQFKEFFMVKGYRNLVILRLIKKIKK